LSALQDLERKKQATDKAVVPSPTQADTEQTSTEKTGVATTDSSEMKDAGETPATEHKP